MSLNVHTFLPGKGSGEGVVGEVLDTPEGVSDLMGPERWRTEVWGSDAMRSVGARYFPVLADRARPGADLIVRPEEVPELLAECRLVRSLVAELVPPEATEAEGARRTARILECLANTEIAAGRALGVGGGVLIW